MAKKYLITYILILSDVISNFEHLFGDSLLQDSRTRCIIIFIDSSIYPNINVRKKLLWEKQLE